MKLQIKIDCFDQTILFNDTQLLSGNFRIEWRPIVAETTLLA